ncbi:MAG: hypothetical protein ACXAEU_07480 [Candidatus Hodarchaeales archaeon]|jgi:hypothetical protein
MRESIAESPRCWRHSRKRILLHLGGGAYQPRYGDESSIEGPNYEKRSWCIPEMGTQTFKYVQTFTIKQRIDCSPTKIAMSQLIKTSS